MSQGRIQNHGARSHLRSWHSFSQTPHICLYNDPFSATLATLQLLLTPDRLSGSKLVDPVFPTNIGSGPAPPRYPLANSFNPVEAVFGCDAGAKAAAEARVAARTVAFMVAFLLDCWAIALHCKLGYLKSRSFVAMSLKTG